MLLLILYYISRVKAQGISVHVGWQLGPVSSHRHSPTIGFVLPNISDFKKTLHKCISIFMKRYSNSNMRQPFYLCFKMFTWFCCFSFIAIIVKSLQKKGERMKSPTFTLDSCFSRVDLRTEVFVLTCDLSGWESRDFYQAHSLLWHNVSWAPFITLSSIYCHCFLTVFNY